MRMGVFGDSHIGIEDKPAMNLMVEIMDAEGCTGVFANGDAVNCGTVSPHPENRKLREHNISQLKEEVDYGREYLNWMAGFPLALYGEGNHENWINRVAVETNTVGSLSVRSALDIPAKIEVLQHGYQVRAGSLVIEHGDIVLGRGSGGANLARTILSKYPDQTTLVNHFHRDGVAIRTSPDVNGVLRSHAAHTLGHMSLPDAHTEYAGRMPDWQQSFALIDFYLVDRKIRFNISHVLIHRDRRNRPYAYHNGKLYS